MSHFYDTIQYIYRRCNIYTLLPYSAKSLSDIQAAILSRSEAASPLLVAIWGPSGSGKTHLSEKLLLGLEEATIFHIDNYLSSSLLTKKFRDIPFNTTDPWIDGLDPNIWDQALLSAHLDQITSGLPINMPIFDNKIRKRVGYTKFIPKKIVIIEGSYALQNKVHNKLGLTIMVGSSFHDRFLRKLVRTYHVTGRKDLEESITRYLRKTQPAAEYFTTRYDDIIDIKVVSSLDPVKEFLAHGRDLLTSKRQGDRMIPKKPYGETHSDEHLSIIKDGTNSAYNLQYTVQDREIFSINISEQTNNLLSTYYSREPIK